MASPAQTAANRRNAAKSTGPKTATGKSASSSNAITSGLFAQRDFVRPEERPLWHQLRDQLLQQLQPVGTLENTFAAEIVSANWRLRRCGLIEAALNDDPTLQPDDQGAEFVHPTYLAVDRARTHATRMLTRSMAQLKALQNERLLREETMPGQDPSELGLASVKAHAVGLAALNRTHTQAETANFEELLRGIDMEATALVADSRKEILARPQKTNPTKRTQSGSLTPGRKSV